MQESFDVSGFAFESLRIRITKVMPAQIVTCIEQLSEQQIWWRPNGNCNSVGNLVLHVRGALLHFLCHRIGGLEYERDRPAEFDAGSEMPKSELLASFNEMVKHAEETFQNLDASRLGDPSTEPAYYTTLFEDLFGIAIHLSVHTGQILYITKMLSEKSLNELWATTHKQMGAWRG